MNRTSVPQFVWGGRCFLPFSIPIAMALAACSANHYAIYRQYRVASSDEPQGRATSIVLDAKERAIIAAVEPDRRTDPSPGSPASNQDGAASPNGLNRRSTRTIICAEPSPDALSAIAAAYSVSAGISSPPSSKTLSGAMNTVENAEKLGVRDATIQILRDGFYRECEAYMDGALTSTNYEKNASRYLDGMVTLLAVEGLTRPAFYTPPGLSPNTPAAAPRIKLGTKLPKGSIVEMPRGGTIGLYSDTSFTLQGKTYKIAVATTGILLGAADAKLVGSTTSPIPADTKATLLKNTSIQLKKNTKYVSTSDAKKPLSLTKDTPITILGGTDVKTETPVALIPTREIEPGSTVPGASGTTPQSQIRPASGRPGLMDTTNNATVRTIVRSYLLAGALESQQATCKKYADENKDTQKIKAYISCMESFPSIVTYDGAGKQILFDKAAVQRLFKWLPNK